MAHCRPRLSALSGRRMGSYPSATPIVFGLVSRRWRRPYGYGPFEVLLLLLLLFGATFFGAAIWSAISQFRHRTGRAIGLLIVAVPLAVVYLGGLGRVLATGICISDWGLRYRGPLRTVSVPWSEVQRVRLAPMRIRWFPARLGAQAIWIDRRNAGPVQTLLSDKSAAYLGRRREFIATFRSLRDEVKRATSERS